MQLFTLRQQSIAGVAAYVVLILLLASPAFSQCATIYTDRSAASDYSTLYAWSSLTDDYTNPSSSCYPFYWGSSFVHSYGSTVTITSPQGRTSTGNGSGQSSSGSTGYSRADVSLAFDESGTYQITDNQTINCSVAGQFYSGSYGGSYNVDNWPAVYGVATLDGNVVLHVEDYNTLVSQGFIGPGVAVVTVVVVPEAVLIIGTATLVAISVYYIGRAAADQIKRMSYDRDLLNYCRAQLTRCLMKGSSCSGGQADVCYGFCTNQGYWPTQMCPL